MFDLLENLEMFVEEYALAIVLIVVGVVCPLLYFVK
jgi:hypothetical protein